LVAANKIVEVGGDRNILSADGVEGAIRTHCSATEPAGSARFSASSFEHSA
jgi:hypothetical protein